MLHAILVFFFLYLFFIRFFLTWLVDLSLGSSWVCCERERGREYTKCVFFFPKCLFRAQRPFAQVWSILTTTRKSPNCGKGRGRLNFTWIYVFFFLPENSSRLSLLSFFGHDQFFFVSYISRRLFLLLLFSTFFYALLMRRDLRPFPALWLLDQGLPSRKTKEGTTTNDIQKNRLHAHVVLDFLFTC